MFSYMLAREGVTDAVASFLQTSVNSSFGVMLFCAVICLFMGCFVDGTATMLLLTPIFVPVVQAMGMDMMGFTIVFMIAIMSGGMTPPVGSMLFIISALEDIPITKMVKPVFHYVAALCVVLLLIMAVPQIASFLPSLIYG